MHMNWYRSWPNQNRVGVERRSHHRQDKKKYPRQGRLDDQQINILGKVGELENGNEKGSSPERIRVIIAAVGKGQQRYYEAAVDAGTRAQNTKEKV
jgi:hypothetical protein